MAPHFFLHNTGKCWAAVVALGVRTLGGKQGRMHQHIPFVLAFISSTESTGYTSAPPTHDRVTHASDTNTSWSEYWCNRLLVLESVVYTKDNLNGPCRNMAQQRPQCVQMAALRLTGAHTTASKGGAQQKALAGSRHLLGRLCDRLSSLSDKPSIA